MYIIPYFVKKVKYLTANAGTIPECAFLLMISEVFCANRLTGAAFSVIIINSRYADRKPNAKEVSL